MKTPIGAKMLFLQFGMTLILSLFVALAPYSNALYYSTNYLFELPALLWALALAPAAGLGGVLLYLNRTTISYRELLAFGAALLVAACAALSHLFSPAVYTSYLFIWINAIAILVYMACSLLFRSDRWMKGMQAVILGSGYLLVLHGVMNLAGVIHYKDAIQLAGDIDNLQLRLNSVFQYANGYAAYLAALSLSSLYVLLHRQLDKLWFVTAWMLFPILLSFLLTASKGGFLVLLVVFALLLLGLSLHRQLSALGMLAFTVVIAMLLVRPISSMAVAIGSDNAAAWHAPILLLTIALATLINALGLWLIRYRWDSRVRMLADRLDRIRSARYLVVGAPVLLLAAAVGLYLIMAVVAPDLIPEFVQTRLANLISFSERLLFYRDSLAMLADHPFTGIGGGAWGEVVSGYKSLPYVSSQTHSFLVQQTVEYGVLGLLGFTLFVGSVLLPYARRSRIWSGQAGARPEGVFFLFACALLLHSLMDFTMTFLYLYMLLFVCLGGLTASLRSAVGTAASSARGLNAARIAGISGIVIVLLAAIAALSLGSTIREHFAFRSAMDVDADTADPGQAIVALGPALDGRYVNPHFVMYGNSLLIRRYHQTGNPDELEQAAASLARLKQRQPYNRAVWEQEYQLLVQQGNLEGAFQFSKQGLEVYPWEIGVYEHLVTTAYQLGLAEQAVPGGEEGAWWNRAIHYYTEAGRRNQQLIADGVTAHNPSIRFDSTDIMHLNVALIHFMREDYASAEAVLYPKLTYYPVNETQKAVDRWYVAALRKQNKDDMALYNQLISIDPQEQKLIEQILEN